MWRERREMTTRLKLAFVVVGFVLALALIALFGRH